MSIFIPYNITDVLTTLETCFTIDLTNITDYQAVLLTLVANAYFFLFWGFIMYFVLKSLNWVYERIC